MQDGGAKFKLEDHFSRSQLRSMGTAAGYALLATKEALEDSGLELDEKLKENTGVAVGMGMVDLSDICKTNDALRKGFVVELVSGLGKYGVATNRVVLKQVFVYFAVCAS